MRFDEFYEINRGLTADTFPTFRYNVVNEHGVYGPTKYGSIRPRFPVATYDENTVQNLLAAHIKEVYEPDALAVVCVVILDKGVMADVLKEYVICTLDALTVATGVVMTTEEDGFGLRTISARHRPNKEDGVVSFAQDIQTMRIRARKGLINLTLHPDDKEVTDGVNELVAKYPQFFVPTYDVMPVVEKHSFAAYLDRIKGFARNGIQLRRIFVSHKRMVIDVGNCTLEFTKHARTLSMRATMSRTPLQPLSYLCKSHNTINEALSDVLGSEMVFMQNQTGYYNTKNEVQYGAGCMVRWIKHLAKSHGMKLSAGESENSTVYEVFSKEGALVIRLSIHFLHATVETFFADGETHNTDYIRHYSDEKKTILDTANFMIKNYPESEK